MGSKERRAFLLTSDAERTSRWINAYNETVRAYLAEHPVKGNLLLHPRIFSKARCEADGLSFTANQIEHGLLRGNRRPPVSLRPVFRKGDPRLELAPLTVDPRIHFALNCGARSCPPIREYPAEGLDAELDLATRSYMDQETRLDREARRIELPYLMRLYRGDFGPKPQQIEFTAAHLPALAAWPERERAEAKVSYRRFDWTAL
ncbi:hypothetical protein BH10ACT11_BH10ACT11_15040 [soil metagenome]